MTSSIFSHQEVKRAGLVFFSSRNPEAHKPIFSGTAYLDKTILIGQEAFLSYLKLGPFRSKKFYDGRFFVMGKEKGHFIAKTDHLGQEILYYYKRGKEWAFSNSFYYLLKWLGAHKYPCTVYEPSLYAGLIGTPLFSKRQGSALGVQLLSNNTSVEEIKVLPKNYFLRIRTDTNELEILEDTNLYINPNKSYEELLYDYVVKWSSRVRSLAEKFPHTFKIDLTGGLDSRVVLALTSFSFPKIGRLHFQSNPRGANPKDFQIAKLIGEFLGFPIKNKRFLKRQISPAESYELWKYGNLGVYFPFYLPTHIKPTDTFYLHGSGGENFRQYYSSTAQKLAHNFPYYFPNKYSCELVQKEFLRSIDDLGYNPFSLEGMREHYQNFRSRFHFGRNWIRNCYANFITPLNALELHYAAKKLSNYHIASNKIHCDLLCLLNPFLATLPFDESSKAFSLEQLENAPFKNLAKEEVSYKPLLVRRAIEEEKEVKEPKVFLREELLEILLKDLAENFEPLDELGDFSHKFKKNLEEGLKNKETFSISAQKASYIISIGTVLKFAEIKNAPKKPLKETLEQNLMQIHHAGKRLISSLSPRN